MVGTPREKGVKKATNRINDEAAEATVETKKSQKVP